MTGFHAPVTGGNFLLVRFLLCSLQETTTYNIVGIFGCRLAQEHA